MLAITIAFRTPHRDSEAICLYVGNDAAEALRIADSKPPGFHSAKVIKNPGWAKQRVYGRENAELEPEFIEADQIVERVLDDEIERLKAELAELKAENAALKGPGLTVLPDPVPEAVETEPDTKKKK